MVPEKHLDEFVSRMRNTALDNLESIILYGSAANGEFHGEYSDLNVLCVFKETSFAMLSAIAPVVEWWQKQKHKAPLMLTRTELERSTDVFSIELLDMRERHRVLYGADLLSALPIPMTLHRAQLEYELREKLILLRERLVLSIGNERQLWDLLLGSVSTFATLFRHTLIALGEQAPTSKRVAVQALAVRFSFDASAFLQVLDIRERKAKTAQFKVEEVFASYLKAVLHVTATVDRMLEAS